MRSATSLAAFLISATLLCPIGHADLAHAAATTCHGQTATIVGTKGLSIQGTNGRDVIVTGGSLNVSAGSGDDLVCFTARGRRMHNAQAYIDAGAGNDVVDSAELSTIDSYNLVVTLGAGADNFVGGPGYDQVIGGESVSQDTYDPEDIGIERPLSEAERDVIDTGGGFDRVYSGGPGLANDDVVRTGDGPDAVTWVGTMAADGVLDAGEDVDDLSIRPSGRTSVVDLTKQTLTRNGVREATFNSIEKLVLTPEPRLGSLEVVGTEQDDRVIVDAPARVQADLAGGADLLYLTALKSGSRLDLGAGTDKFQLDGVGSSHPFRTVDLDLTKGTLDGDGLPVAEIAGVEDVEFAIRFSRVVGNSEANVVRADGCQTNVHGGGGNDLVRYHTDLNCNLRSAHLYGGSGDDRLLGYEGPDTLVGGPGRDTLYGSGGRDTARGGTGRDQCHAEVYFSCSRSRQVPTEVAAGL